MKNTQSWGAKSLFLLRCLHAGWCPATKYTNRATGELRCNFPHQHLVLFKRQFFIVFNRNLAVMRTKEGILEEIYFYRINYLSKNPFKVVLRKKDTQNYYAIDLESPEIGQIPVYPYKKDIYFKFLRRLEKFVSENGKAATQTEFYALVKGIVNNQLSVEIIKKGVGTYWEKRVVRYPYGYNYYPLPAHVIEKRNQTIIRN